MNDLGLGRLIVTTVGPARDAVHVAVVPMTAQVALKPGDHVDANGGFDGEPVAVVDPFLMDGPAKGQRFWGFLFPNTITSLRHEWVHPAFPVVGEQPQFSCTKEDSEEWLRSFCRDNDCPDFDVVIAAATDKPVSNRWPQYYEIAYRNDGEYLHFNGSGAHAAIPPEFWDHVENYTGVKIPREKRATGFSCSC